MSWEYLQASLLKEEYSRIFCHIQAFLVAVANLSKILWNEKFTSRGEELRRVLQVPTDSPVKDKNIRNVFEHYDERIESWVNSSKRRHISDMNISISGFSAIPDLDPIDCMRNLDISHDRKNLTLTFNDKPYNLTMTKHAVTELQERARKLRPSLFWIAGLMLEHENLLLQRHAIIWKRVEYPIPFQHKWWDLLSLFMYANNFVVFLNFSKKNFCLEIL